MLQQLGLVEREILLALRHHREIMVPYLKLAVNLILVEVVAEQVLLEPQAQLEIIGLVMEDLEQFLQFQGFPLLMLVVVAVEIILIMAVEKLVD